MYFMSNQKSINVRTILRSRFKGLWEHFHQLTDKIPEDRLHEGEESWQISWVLYHMIETAEFYYQNSPDMMKWGRRAGLDWKKNTEDEIRKRKKDINKDMLQEYAQEIEKKIEDYLEQTTDAALLEKDGFEYFDSVVGKLIYLLQHNHYHIGELASILRSMDAERFKW